MPKQNDLEQKALNIIMSRGEKGILQSDLWREMNASSREGSRISIRLESKGLIYREPELSRGRWTYRLYSKRQPISIDSIIDCPCLSCEEISRCGAGSNISPNDCEKLTRWILKE
ncbi:transcriptional regulator [Candidatus Bathyarchaeota archaeon]|nr:transcriptional regulator [Candidatus Bathyarchaeota archaeon]HDO41826.1 transcriptional regulator [Candidatus Bathyarchaeota archaeon]